MRLKGLVNLALGAPAPARVTAAMVSASSAPQQPATPSAAPTPAVETPAEQPENRHFIQDYQLTNKSVVVVEEVGGTVARWVKLDNVWGLVGNHDAYLAHVQDAVRAYVEN